jgi:hypothetical protein
MYSMRRRGLAGLVSLTPQAIANCAGGGARYYFDPLCWEYSPSAWNEMASFQSPAAPVAPAAIPSAYTAVAPTVADASQQTTDVLNAAALQSQEQNLAAAQNQSTICDSDQTLAADGVTCVDNNPSTNWALWGAVALVSVFGVVALAGGSPRRHGG